MAPGILMRTSSMAFSGAVGEVWWSTVGSGKRLPARSRISNEG